MGIEDILDQTYETKDVNEFVTESHTIYKHYDALGDEITKEYIAVRLNTMYNQQKERPYLIGFLEDEPREIVDQMGEIAQSLMRKRIGKPAISQIIISFLVMIAWYQLMTTILKLESVMAAIVTGVVLIGFNYFYSRWKATRLIRSTNALYQEKVESRILAFFHHYLD